MRLENLALQPFYINETRRGRAFTDEYLLAATKIISTIQALQPLDHSDQPMTCSWDSPESLHTDRRTHALSDLTIHIPDSFSSECGTLITAELRESEKMVMQLITTVTDMKRVFDDLKAEEDAVKQAQQRQREQLYQQEKITNRSSRLQTQTLR